MSIRDQIEVCAGSDLDAGVKDKIAQIFEQMPAPETPNKFEEKLAFATLQDVAEYCESLR